VVKIPNKCTGCGKIHPDNADYLINGCDECGSKFFFFVREEDLQHAEKDIKELTRDEIDEIEQDIRDIISEEKAGDIKLDDTVILDVEAVRVIKPGKYRIDVTTLFRQRPIVIRIGPGKYELDLSTIMPKLKKKIKEAL